MQTPPCLMQLRNSLVYDITLRVGEFWNHMSANDASKTSRPKGIIKSKNQQDFFFLWCLDNMGKKWCRAFLKMECPDLQVFHFYDYKWWFLQMMMFKGLALREKLLYKLFLSDFELQRAAWSSITSYSGESWANTVLHWHTGLQISYHYAACQTGLRIFEFLAITRWFWLWLVDHNDALMWVMVNWSSICSMLL